MTISRKIPIEIEVEELAEEFAELGSTEQVQFFNLVAERFVRWGYANSDRQLCDVGTQLSATPGGNWVSRLAEFIDENT